MPNQHISRRDIDFLLDEWLDIPSLAERARFADHSPETFRSALDLAEAIAVKEFAPHNKLSDSQEPRLRPDGTVETIPQVRSALDSYFTSGLHSAPFPARFGGMDLPVTIRTALGLWFAAANSSTWGYASLTAAAANLLLTCGSEHLIDRFARPLVSGRFLGTMCLSETEAGSSLADITTRAMRQPDGTFRIYGNKMWISAGDHELGENIVHMVLARTGDSALGVKGTSLFVVPKFLVSDSGEIGERNDITLVGLNHKMGNRGTTNTVLAFGSGDHRPAGNTGAVGYLVGEENRGIFHMFHMMNEMRISVGASAVGLGYAGYLASLDYARTRKQGRKTAGTKPVPIVEHADVRRMLLAQKSYVEGALALVLYCGRLMDEVESTTDPDEKQRVASLLDLLTPIAKSFPAQWCVAANDLAIQVHGGYGYTRDYDVEQHYRDNRLNPIHEGTHGIQGLDLLGRKVRARDGADLAYLAQLIRATVIRARAKDAATAQLGAALAERVDRLVSTTNTLWSGEDSELALANASLYLEAAGHVVVAWLWLEQHLATGDHETEFHRGKRLAARYFFEYELPKVDAQLTLLGSRSRTLLDADQAWL